MKKILNIMSKYENILIFLLILFSITAVTLCVSLSSNDELWNFQNVYKMYNGFEIYNDANVICTPLFFYIGNIIFHLLGANFLVFRIYSIIIFTIFYFLTYILLRKLEIDKKIACLFTIILMMFGNYILIRIMANYNSMAIMFSIIGIYLLIKDNAEINAKNIMIQSIICFVIELTKQNIGVFYAIGLLAVILINSKKNRTKNVLEEIGILLLLSIIFIFSLKLTGKLEGFLNYAVLGMGQFVGLNRTFRWTYVIIIGSIITVNAIVSYIFIKNQKKLISKREKNNIIILNCFSIPLFLAIFPIMNESHFLLSIHIGIILSIYIISIILKAIGINKNKNLNKIINVLIVIIVVIDMLIAIDKIIVWSNYVFEKDYYYKYKDPYFGAVVSKELNDNIEEVTQFIKKEQEAGSETIVFSSKAALYMVPLKKSNGFIDLPFYGNFGILNEDEVIEKIEKMENTLLLLEKEEKNLEWQESEKIIKTLKQDLEKIGEIEEFEIYKIQ